jgi:hypothetical protein
MDLGRYFLKTPYDRCGREAVLVACPDEEVRGSTRALRKKMERRKTAPSAHEHRYRAFYWKRKSFSERAEEPKRLARLCLAQESRAPADYAVDNFN